MPRQELRNCGGELLYSVEAADIRAAVETAVREKIDLTGVDLGSLDLSGVQFAGAKLNGANFTRAHLYNCGFEGAEVMSAHFNRTQLSGANFRDANLAHTQFCDAQLAASHFLRANLALANFSRAVLTDADFVDADLRGAWLADCSGLRQLRLVGARLANLRIGNTAADRRIPVVPSLHRQMLQRIQDAGPGSLDMDNWHSCETSHCRAGWAIHLAGEAGRALEARVGSHLAGALIHIASCPFLDGVVPEFLRCTKDDALQQIKDCAAQEPPIGAEIAT